MNGQPEARRDHELPKWQYHAPDPQQHRHLEGETVMSFPPLDGPHALDVGEYSRSNVTNVDMNEKGRAYFDLGLRSMLSYQHEIASKCFLASLEYSPHCALAHGLLALCHAPNYNFKGQPYYCSANHYEDIDKHDLLCLFPSQQVAERHSKLAMEKVEEIRKLHRSTISKRKGKKGKKGAKKSEVAVDNKDTPSKITDMEVQWLAAIRILTCCPGVNPDLSDETVGRPYAEAMRKVYQKHNDDPDITYCFVEALVVPNAWNLYEYPSGNPLSADVVETRDVLERALALHPQHAGLCHLYVHLMEMSAQPEKALSACAPLRDQIPHAGHLIHMPTHIDVLVGDYESCVKYNQAAVLADRHVMQCSPSTAGKESFYFGYIVHNYHMATYGAILGGMEGKAIEVAKELIGIVNEEMLTEFPDLAAYLESYSALDVHVMIRFGRWKQILEIELPKDQRLMLYRSASTRFARALAYAATGNIVEANKEADHFDNLRKDEEANFRILHNNTISDLFAVDAVMMRGEIAYREGKYDGAFALLRKAVDMQDNLNYDEPWGIMQPFRHALGGLLLEQGHAEEAAQVFRKDLVFHPKNPWALVGLIQCLKQIEGIHSCCSSKCSANDVTAEIANLEQELRRTKESEWADYDVVVACECCQHPDTKDKA